MKGLKSEVENIKPSIIERYSESYYPIVLLDSDSLKIIYKNKAARATKMKPRVGVHIKNYMNEENLRILETLEIGEGKEIVIELNIRPSRCVARVSDDMIVLVFLDSLNLIQDCSPELIQKIEGITAKYDKEKMLFVGKHEEIDTAKAQKLRMYLDRYIDNLIMDETKEDLLHTYCDIIEFLRGFERGVSQILEKMGYQVSFDMGDRDDMFIYLLNENDFLTLNFILMSYALTRSTFGVLNVRFEAKAGTLTYEFMSVVKFEDQEGNIDLELAKLIAKNNKLELAFFAADDSDNLIERKSEGKAQIAIRFTKETGIVSQQIKVFNIIDADVVAERAEIEFIELVNLYNM